MADYEYKPYPKWLHCDGEPSVLVKDEAEHEAALAAREPAPAVDEGDAKPKKGGRKAKADDAAAEALADAEPAPEQAESPVFELDSLPPPE